MGLEPVAVAARTNDEVWVVNHLSDSVSVVELDDDADDRAASSARSSSATSRATSSSPDRGGSGRSSRRRTGARTSRSIPSSRPRAWGARTSGCSTRTALGNALGGTPLTIVTLFTDTPRALAVTPDGARVYAAGFHTGNRTTIVAETALPDGFGPDGVPGPATNSEGPPAPEVGAIVKWNGAHWVDALGRPRDST